MPPVARLARLFLLLLAPALLRADGEAPAPNPAEDRFFEVILSDAERAEYQGLPQERRGEWRRRFWAGRDPTPTTDENQREKEHQERIVEAIREFRNKNGEFVFDDRVRAYIRFGDPKVRKTIPGEVVVHEGLRPPREFWLYDDMLLWFEDPSLEGKYVAGLTEKVSNIGATDQYLREDTGWQMDEQLLFEESFDQFLQIEGVEVDPVLAKRMADDGMHRWFEVPEINDYDYGGAEEFRFVFDINYMAGPGGKTDVLVGFLIPLDKFVFEEEGGLESAKIQRRAVLFDPDYNIVERRVENLEHVLDPAARERSRWIATCDSFRVDPGPYNLALRVLDPRSGNHGILKSPLRAADFGGATIRISDLLFAGEITRSAQGNGAYLRNGYRIVPRPIRVYTAGEDIRVYFEIYHITTGEGGRGLYEVEYTLFGTKAARFVSFFGGSSEGKLEQGVGQTFRTQSSGPDAARHISLSTADLPDDRYTLTIDVTDLANGSTDRVSAQFVIKS